jgi:aspartyl-tRNA(Asn)/glutamyl-tRNA(Gln) amidotransferase subunit A
LAPEAGEDDAGSPAATGRGDAEGDSDGGGEPAPGPRLGLVEQFFMDRSDRAVRAATAAALERLREAGAEIVPVRFPDGFLQVRLLHRQIMAVEAAAFHRKQFAKHASRYGPLVRELIEEGMKVSAVDYADALARQRRYAAKVERMLRDVDALVMPAADTTAPPLSEGTTGTPKFQAPWSCAGLPVVSLPSGTAEDGLPVGLQLVGRRFGESDLFRTAAWCEERLGFEGVPAILGNGIS